jgi:hypothetical protein
MIIQNTKFNTQNWWLRVALFNLLVVSSLGVIMRYKIAFSLPFIDQKHFLQAHSHFAFAGWITQALMALMIGYLSSEQGSDAFKKYKGVLVANVVTAYGMLLSFPFQGYGFLSITFSTLSIFVSYAFAIMYWRDLNKLKIKSISHLWFKAALIFFCMSSVGPFTLADMMATKNINQNWSLAALYFFLHFQYNGWFFFAGMGLLTKKLEDGGANKEALLSIFRMFVFACPPAYFLSVLWADVSIGVYIMVVIAALMQLAAWVYLLQQMNKLRSFFDNIHQTAQWILNLSAIALTVKLLLQLGSTIPSVSHFAFGFRPIVIGYLHLVLLGVITLFIVGYMFAYKLISINPTTIIGVSIFTIGVVVNEIFLMSQGFASVNYNSIPYINETLLGIATVMFFGLLLLFSGQKEKQELLITNKNINQLFKTSI